MFNYYVIAWGIIMGGLIIIFFHIALSHTSFLVKNGLPFFALCGLLCLLRIFLPFDFSGKRILEYPAFLSWLLKDRFLFGGRILLLDFILLIFLGIALILIARYHLKLWNIMRVFKEHSTIHEEGTRILKTIDSLISIPVRQTKLTNTPLICGFIHPVIYLPYFDFSEEDLSNILLHEYSHRRYHHTTIKYFVHLLVLLLWWNPLIYIFERDFSHFLELVCDNMVLHYFDNKGKISYISTILHCLDFIDREENEVICSAYFMGFLPQKVLALSPQETSTEQRIQYHLQNAFLNQRMPVNLLLYGGVLICFLLSFFFMAQPAILPEEGADYSNESNSYLVELEDGSYDFYFEDEWIKVYQNDIEDGYYSIYPIIPYSEYKSTGDYKDASTYKELFLEEK